jgi:hypothetical protein
LGERLPYKQEVAGSSPAPPIAQPSHLRPVASCEGRGLSRASVGCPKPAPEMSESDPLGCTAQRLRMRENATPATIKDISAQPDLLDVRLSTSKGKGALGPGYWAMGVPTGTLVAALAGAAGDVRGLLLGLFLIAFSGWLAMNRLADGPCLRSGAWVVIYSLVTLAVIALAALVDSRPTMYTLVALGVLAGPWLASQVSGENRPDS